MAKNLFDANFGLNKAFFNFFAGANIVKFNRGKTTSFVWNYYEKISRTEALCQICGKVNSTPTGSTSGLRKHLEATHGILENKKDVD